MNAGALPPAVSVILPTFNRAEFLPQAIDSVLAQDHPALELLVVDDGSTDSTPEIVAGYPPAKVRYLRRERGGPAAARNAGLAEARGALIAFLDSDDYYLPGKLSAQARMLAADRRLGAVHSGWRIVDERGDPQRDVEPWRTAPVLDLRTWLLWKPVFLGGLMVRAEWLRRAGPFNPRLYQTDDVEMMFRLAAAGCRMGWLKRPTVCYRRHGANITRDGAGQAGDLMAAVDSFYAAPDLPARARDWEGAVRYHTLLWLAFDRWSGGDAARTASLLKETIPWSEQAPDQIPVAWLGALARRAKESGADGDAAGRLARLIAEIPVPDNPDPERTHRILDWLGQLWWEYLAGRNASPGRIRELSQGLSVREIVKSLQTVILAGACGDMPRGIDRLWADLLRARVVPSDRSWEAATLHLTVFSQSVFRRDARTAARALARAARTGATPRAAPVWGRFLRAAVRYFLSPKGQKPNKISAARKSIS